MKKLASAIGMFGLAFWLASGAGAAELAVGQAAPDFTLTDIHGDEHSLSDYQGQYVVLEWTNHGCPFVVKHYDSNNMQKLQATYTDKEVVWLTINSSAPGKQGHHSPEEWAELVEEKGSAASATLLDGDGTVGRLYGAKTTPHMYIIDPSGKLIYQGAIDSVASTNVNDVPNAKNYVAAALDEALAGKPVSEPSTKAYGCSVKY